MYLSIGGFGDKTTKTIKFLNQNNIFDLELSGGRYEKNIKKKLINLTKKNNFLLHNYFPPPNKTFVLNLASLDPVINKKSFEHIIKSIDLSKKLNSKYFSFHAGFYIDPKIQELGKKISYSDLYNEKESKKIFVKNLRKIIQYAKKKKIKILLENNVITKKNLKTFKKNPFIFTDFKDLLFLIAKIKNKKFFSFLLDVAHLKVSCATLKKNFSNELKKISKYCSAYHLSDNNGAIDNNKPFKKNSQFWSYIRRDVDFATVEVYSKNIKILKTQINLAKNFFNKKKMKNIINKNEKYTY